MITIKLTQPIYDIIQKHDNHSDTDKTTKDKQDTTK